MEPIWIAIGALVLGSVMFGLGFDLGRKSARRDKRDSMNLRHRQPRRKAAGSLASIPGDTTGCRC